MAKKTSHDAAKKRASKEKKMLVVLIVFLVVALGYAYKTLTKVNSSAPPTPVASATADDELERVDRAACGVVHADDDPDGARRCPVDVQPRRLPRPAPRAATAQTP